jgi:hypothetical protein
MLITKGRKVFEQNNAKDFNVLMAMSTKYAKIKTGNCYPFIFGTTHAHYQRKECF